MFQGIGIAFQAAAETALVYNKGAFRREPRLVWPRRSTIVEDRTPLMQLEGRGSGPVSG